MALLARFRAGHLPRGGLEAAVGVRSCCTRSRDKDDKVRRVNVMVRQRLLFPRYAGISVVIRYIHDRISDRVRAINTKRYHY